MEEKAVKRFHQQSENEEEEQGKTCLGEGRERKRRTKSRISSSWSAFLGDAENEPTEESTHPPSYKKSRTVACVWRSMLPQEVRHEKGSDGTTGDSCSKETVTYDQGNHEVEVGVEAHEAATSWNRCQKNPGHTDFVAAPKFCIDDLPERYRDKDILTYIKLWSQLIVKVITRYTSHERTDGYPFHSIKGSCLPRTGSGKVTDITLEENYPCPCPDCVASGKPKKVWKAIWIMTALHVVYDDDEAIKTDIEFYFDDPIDRSKVRTLRGIRVVDFNVKGDWCKFEVACHDLDLAQQLEQAEKPLFEIATKIGDKYEENTIPPLAVIASHPHGCAKQISVGEWKDKKYVENKEENCEWTEYTYTTATCMGSSGAPVWILGPNRVTYVAYYYHVHSEGLHGGVNKSGAGDVQKRWDWGTD